MKDQVLISAWFPVEEAVEIDRVIGPRRRSKTVRQLVRQFLKKSQTQDSPEI